MNIEVGSFYANDHIEDGVKETNIILVLPDDETTPKFQTRTETMWLSNGAVQDIYENNWISDFFQREATEKEISFFKKHRAEYGQLKNFSESVLDEMPKE